MNTDKDKKDKKKDSGVRDEVKVTAEDHIKIIDVKSGRDIVNKRG